LPKATIVFRASTAPEVSVTPELINHLYKVPKVCPDYIQWKPNTSVSYENHTFVANLVTEDEDVLEWRGYFQIKHFQRRWGFSITYRRKYVVRSWDMAKKHYSQLEGRFIRGVGCHKHYYHDDDHPRAAYEIPQGEISVEDPNQAVIDFREECNIEFRRGYQRYIFPELGTTD
jgi:hypothetical protein